MGLQLIRGRAIQASDRAGTPSVGLINDTAARQFFANDEPLGKTLTFRGPVVIVGIIRSVRNFGPEVAAQPELYVALDQSSGNSSELGGDLVVRTAVPAANVAAAIRDGCRPIPSEDLITASQNRRVLERFRREVAFYTCGVSVREKRLAGC
jgi:putative ABC transport system permease protein